MRIPPPATAALYLLAAWGVTRALPNEPIIPRGPVSLTIAALLAAAGAALAVTAALTFRRRETTVHPFGTPTHLVTSGPFAYTRNPMYIGVTLVLAGVAVFDGQAAFCAVPFAFLYTANRYYVPREEKLVAELFPEEFRKYREEVRRWV